MFHFGTIEGRFVRCAGEVMDPVSADPDADDGFDELVELFRRVPAKPPPFPGETGGVRDGLRQGRTSLSVASSVLEACRA